MNQEKTEQGPRSGSVKDLLKFLPIPLFLLAILAWIVLRPIGNQVVHGQAPTPVPTGIRHGVPESTESATGELRFAVRTERGWVFGTFELINRNTQEKQMLVVPQGQAEHARTVPVGEYAIVPDYSDGDRLDCITHEGTQAYSTRCSWKGTEPRVFRVEAGKTVSVRPRPLWIATEQEQQDPCGKDGYCVRRGLLCAQDPNSKHDHGMTCERLCGIDPVTKQDWGGCLDYDKCLPIRDGYSSCKEQPYRTPISL
jgi:hypothetical protein